MHGGPRLCPVGQGSFCSQRFWRKISSENEVPEIPRQLFVSEAHPTLPVGLGSGELVKSWTSLWIAAAGGFVVGCGAVGRQGDGQLRTGGGGLV